MVFERLRALIMQQFAVGAEAVNMDTSFTDDLGADSLDIVELTMSIEEEFDLTEMDEDILATLLTVGDVTKYISGKIDD